MKAKQTTQNVHAAIEHIHIISMNKIFKQHIDFTKVDTLIYHLPNGPTLSVEMNGLEDLFEIDMEMGEICDTSDIDGVVHFFPKGNA